MGPWRLLSSVNISEWESAQNIIIKQREKRMSLGEFHHNEEAPTKSSKITAWVVIALIVGAVAVYVVESGMLNHHPAQAASEPRGL